MLGNDVSFLHLTIESVILLYLDLVDAIMNSNSFN